MTEKSTIPAAVAEMLRLAEAQARIFKGEAPSPKADRSSRRDRPSPEDAAETLRQCAMEPETDLGNANRFLMRHQADVLHVARVGWHGYDGRHWKEDEDGSVVRPLAQKTAEAVADEPAALAASGKEMKVLDEARQAEKDLASLTEEDEDKQNDLIKKVSRGKDIQAALNKRRAARARFAKSTASTSKINNMLTESAPHVARLVNHMNTDIHAINCKNGTLRFIREENEESDPDDPTYSWRARLDPHRPDDYISKLAEVDYQPGIVGDDFDRFFKTVQPNPDMRAFLKRFAGYSLLGSTAEQCLLFFYGAGRNGKSTFVDLLCEILGNYAVTLSIDSFTGEGRRSGAEATPDLARLPGARFVAANEPETGVQMKEALIKTLTGGEKIPVRRLMQEFIEVIPQFKIVISGNHKPIIRDTSDGIWRRFLLVPWEVQIPPEDVDRDLPRRLRKEAPAVFAWMVEGALEYLNYGLEIPDSVRAATQEYREDSDPIGAFIRGACLVTGDYDDSATPEQLFLGYSNWARQEGQVQFKTMATLTRRLPEYSRKQWKAPDGTMQSFVRRRASTVSYRGIRVKTEFLVSQSHSEGT